VRKQDIF